jgi:hypothetical protein
MSKKGKKVRFTVERQQPDGRFRPILGLVYSSRKSARAAVSRVSERHKILERKDAFRVGVVHEVVR